MDGLFCREGECAANEEASKDCTNYDKAIE